MDASRHLGKKIDYPTILVGKSSAGAGRASRYRYGQIPHINPDSFSMWKH